MRVHNLVFVICLVHSAKVYGENSLTWSPTFELVEERSNDGIPSISVTFPDGYKDNLVLNRFYANDEDRMAKVDHCHYIGHLANEPEACVAVTGCFGSEDLEFTILSSHATKSTLFKWAKEGHVEVIEDSLKFGKRDAIPIPRANSQDEDDEIILDDLEAALVDVEKNVKYSALPPTQHLQIRVGYGENFRTAVGGNYQAEAYIAAIWPHLQVNYCHGSLGSKVLIERLPGIKHYVGKYLNMQSLPSMYYETVRDRGSADLMLYMGYNGAGLTMGGGIAYLSSVCAPSSYDKYKQSINCYGTSHSHMGYLLAHEIGHNLGMSHDFDPKHGGHYGACNNQGIMSYNNPPRRWSTCSVKDFTAQYTVHKNSWCMPAAPSACGGGGGGSCKDSTEYAGQCPGWAANGECSNSAEFMMEHCKKSCDACEDNGGDCKDANEFATSCPGWASNGECSKNPEFMLEKCKKSCNACEDNGGDCKDSNASCPGWASNGECSKNPGYMLESCKKSCNACDGGNCKDSNEYATSCPGWASNGECSKNPGFMLVSCKKSCNACN